MGLDKYVIVLKIGKKKNSELYRIGVEGDLAARVEHVILGIDRVKKAWTQNLFLPNVFRNGRSYGKIQGPIKKGERTRAVLYFREHVPKVYSAAHIEDVMLYDAEGEAKRKSEINKVAWGQVFGPKY